MSLTAYIRYDSQGRIVPGGPIVTKTKPAVGNWQVVTQGTSATLVGQLRAFVKLDRYNKPLAGSLFLGKSKPATGKWLEVNATYEGAVTPATTTTTTTSNVVYTITGYGNWNSGAEACVAYGAGLLVYSSTPQQSVGNGTRLYTNQQLTTPLEVAYVSINGNSYSNTNGLLSNQQPCPTTTTTTTAIPLVYADYEASRFTQFLCPPQTGATINVGVPDGDIATASIIYCNFQPTFTSNDTIFIKFNVSGTYYTRQFITNSTATSATPTGSPVACS